MTSTDTNPHRTFMRQFKEARKEVASFKVWMGESAKWAVLTFPKVNAQEKQS